MVYVYILFCMFSTCSELSVSLQDVQSDIEVIILALHRSIYVLVKAPSRVQYGNCRTRGVVETR